MGLCAWGPDKMVTFCVRSDSPLSIPCLTWLTGRKTGKFLILLRGLALLAEKTETETQPYCSKAREAQVLYTAARSYTAKKGNIGIS